MSTNHTTTWSILGSALPPLVPPFGAVMDAYESSTVAGYAATTTSIATVTSTVDTRPHTSTVNTTPQGAT